MLAVPTRAQAQSAEDELGNWLIYNGTFRFSDRWSVFTEAQLRLYQVTSDVNEAFVRAAAHYNFNPDALVGLGYMRSGTWAYSDGTREVIEDRVYQQFTIQHFWDRTRLEHRYRLEQRWIEEGGDTRFSNRLRYRVQVTAPLNRPAIEPGAWFINAYDEIFLNWDSSRGFDQNRLYVAGGYQFTSLANLQLGMLWQARSSLDFYRLQIFYTHNFDFR